MDCGPACLRMISKYYGRIYSLQKLRDLCQINRDGVSLLGISEAAENLGFRALGARLNVDQVRGVTLPCILHWQQNHFVVLYKIKKGRYYIADPARGLLVYSAPEFTRHWLSGGERQNGISLIISPSPSFYDHDGEKTDQGSRSFMLRYLRGYRQLIMQLIFGLGMGAVLQLIAPFLTQALVDTGINTRNLGFVYVILIAQLMLFLGATSVDFIRSWILLHISTRINVSILTDFLIKLMRLPMRYFDTKTTGDIMQRMTDQGRIQSFLTGSALSMIFSLFNFVVFALVLAYYSLSVFSVFMTGSTIYTIWIFVFLKSRRQLDFKKFELSSKNQSNIVQLIGGMQEIKLNNCEQQKRWDWEHIQASLFRFSVKSLALGQYQQAGASFINQGKNIIITFLSAKAVIDGSITLGGMLAIQYIVGQLNSPVEQFLGFIQGFQDARISLERLNEIQGMDDEDPLDRHCLHELPEDRSLRIRGLSFRYPGAGNEPVLENIDLDIAQGKTTAIVGMSGSGKTTILKLLLRFYPWEKGGIDVGDKKLNQINIKLWRKSCGTVMQDGFIFSDTIAGNIVVGDENPDKKRLQYAVHVANIQEFINSLPSGLDTMIGDQGNGISQGQRQRILIARAVYKDPDYIFFDEATNALDANNERVIMSNLHEFFRGRTVVVIAHRLSTVSNADHIVMLHQGCVIEQGDHHGLTAKKGAYYNLVKNQLELGI